MADRRRRKCPEKDNSDAGSDDSIDEALLRNLSNPGSDAGNSEYESVEEEELGEEEEDVLDEEEANKKPPDGTEEDSKPLDHDEDRKNPQYIPKKGTFYEHDDRTMAEEGEEIPDTVSEKSLPPQEKKEVKKKVWREDDKWQHDRFSAFDQSPKSREELVATYGYDIRNEEGPPRARRRRRYGRGPNKYTRNWEDLDAYSKPTRGRGVVRGVGGRGRRRGNLSSNSEEDFPSLPDKTVFQNDENEDQIGNIHNLPVTVPDTQKIVENINLINYTAPEVYKPKVSATHSPRSPPQEEKRREPNMQVRGGRPSNRRGRVGRGGYQGNYSYGDGGQFVNKNRPDIGRGSSEMKGRGLSGRGGHNQSLVGNMNQLKEVKEITDELKSITISSSHKDEHHYNKGKRGMDNRRNTIPPRLQESMRGNKLPNDGGDPNSISKPKRYSSQRQRSLQDQVGPYHHHHQQGYYEQAPNESSYQNSIYERSNSSPNAVTHSVPVPLTQLSSLAGTAPPSFVPPLFTTSPPTFPPEPFLGRSAAPRMFPPVTQPHLIGPVPVPPSVPGPPVPGTVGGPPVTGPPFLPPENMINFAAGAPGLVAAPHSPQFPAFQAFTPVSQQQPQEIYSNGVMYYNTQSQQHLPRMNPILHKRPKAAIPIVPPPDKQPSNSQKFNEDEQNISYNNLQDEQYSNTGEDYESVAYEDYREGSAEYDSQGYEDYPADMVDSKMGNSASQDESIDDGSVEELVDATETISEEPSSSINNENLENTIEPVCSGTPSPLPDQGMSTTLAMELKEEETKFNVDTNESSTEVIVKCEEIISSTDSTIHAPAPEPSLKNDAVCSQDNEIIEKPNQEESTGKLSAENNTPEETKLNDVEKESNSNEIEDETECTSFVNT